MTERNCEMATLVNKQFDIYGVTINPLTMQEAVDYIASWIVNGDNDCKFIVTPNVNCVVQLSENAAYRDAFQHAAMVVVDGKPVVLTARMFGESIPGTVTGSDLVPNVFSYFQRVANHELKVFLLGAMPGVAAQAADKIESQWQHVKVVGTYSPPFGFEKDALECARICEMIASSGAEFLVIGLGAPKQATWVKQYRKQLPIKVAICAGATIDFLAGNKPRAPKWVSDIGMEWLYRMASEPRRLGKRYLNDALTFPGIVWREWLMRRRSSH